MSTNNEDNIRKKKAQSFYIGLPGEIFCTFNNFPVVICRNTSLMFSMIFLCLKLRTLHLQPIYITERLPKIFSSVVNGAVFFILLKV